MREIKLRPHHVDFFRQNATLFSRADKGLKQHARKIYIEKHGKEGLDFIEKTSATIKSDPDIRITIVRGSDDLCKKCYLLDKCEGPLPVGLNRDQRNLIKQRREAYQRLDDIRLDVLNLRENETYASKDLFPEFYEISTSIVA